MEENEKTRIENCINNMQDKLESIKKEIELEKPYTYYILEKIELIINDAKIIKNICESEEIKNGN